MKKSFSIRCKSQEFGLSCKWTFAQNTDGKWKIIALGGVKNGRNPVPTSFVPFGLSDVVMRAIKPTFDSAAEVEAYVRAL